MRTVVKKPKAKRYLFIGGPSDRKRISVDRCEHVYVISRVGIDFENIANPNPTANIIRHVYHLESLTVDGETSEAYIYDDLWKDRTKLFAHLLANYGKPKKYPRRKRLTYNPSMFMDPRYRGKIKQLYREN